MLKFFPILLKPTLFQTKPTVQANQSSLKPTPADSVTPSAKLRQGNSAATIVETIQRLRKTFPDHIKTVTEALRWHGNKTEEHTANQEIAAEITQLVDLQVQVIDSLGAKIKALQEENALLEARVNLNAPKTW